MSSANQDQWQEITAAMRAHLARMTKLLPAMKPEEVAAFVNTLDVAMFVELKAATFDEDIEERQALAKRNSTFGG